MIWRGAGTRRPFRNGSNGVDNLAEAPLLQNSWEDFGFDGVEQGEARTRCSAQTHPTTRVVQLLQEFAMFRSLKSVVVAGIVAVGLSAASHASAGDCPVPRHYWKTVVTYRHVEQPCSCWVTKYDHCGQAHRVQVTSYQTVKVPVEHRVKVYY